MSDDRNNENTTSSSKPSSHTLVSNIISNGISVINL